MIVYWSILAYTCIVALIGCGLKRRALANVAEEELIFKQQKSISLFFALLSVALLVFFVGMRTEYGDTSVYISNFNNLSTSFSVLKQKWINKEDNVLFWTIAILFKRFVSNDPNAWLFLIAVFQAGAVTKFNFKYSDNFAFSIFFFIATTDAFGWMMNGIKQFTAVCLILYFFDYVIERKFVVFMIIVFVAYFIHPTAMVWIPVYFILSAKPFSFRIWIYVAITLTAIIFVDNFTDLLNDSLESTKYAGNDITAYDNKNGNIDDGVNPIRVLIYIIPPGLALLKWKEIKAFSNPLISICINLATISVGVFALGMVTSGILIGRIPMYFELANYILMPWLLKYVYRDKFGTFLKIACISGYLAYFTYNMFTGSGYYVSSILGLYLYN